MAALHPAIRATARLFRNKSVQAGGTLVVGLGWVGIVSDGFTAWSWLQRWREALDWVETPYFVLAVAAAALLLVWRGARQVLVAEQQGGLEIIASQKRETALRAEVLQGVHALTRFYWQERRIFEAEIQVARVEQLLTAYGSSVETLKTGGKRAWDSASHPLKHSPDVPASFVRTLTLHVGIPDCDLGLQTPQPTLGSTISQSSPRNASYPTFDPQENTPFFHAHETNITILRRRVADARKLLEGQKKALEKRRALMESLLNGQA